MFAVWFLPNSDFDFVKRKALTQEKQVHFMDSIFRQILLKIGEFSSSDGLACSVHTPFNVHAAVYMLKVVVVAVLNSSFGDETGHRCFFNRHHRKWLAWGSTLSFEVFEKVIRNWGYFSSLRINKCDFLEARNKFLFFVEQTLGEIFARFRVVHQTTGDVMRKGESHFLVKFLCDVIAHASHEADNIISEVWRTNGRYVWFLVRKYPEVLEMFRKSVR